ncbi:type II toxin-antitoxin system RelE/ParE family toxin [Candidatus Bathyarchaeota archaeon]|nr:MAG: type II toxin-antitoxin system RelE/ParE family toxin [Candidatus Bathyarchaeota archaeon]RLI17283.1 MAG: type II toxin-antitoxin system mRNA interferase toxin, RelE/StbE family [Candidatus Bathyarchaeota archaeon]HDD70457.1 type II toxin-antitoxin system RelE/ParE family toxin [Candidatus Bathyarchaeota archaeon]
MKKKFELFFAREFLRKIKKLDKQVQVRILKELRVLENDPFCGKRLFGRLSGLFSLRVGEYRVIYSLSGDKVIVRTVGHRRRIYER